MVLMTVFSKKTDVGYILVSQGIFRKTLISGARTLMTEFRLKKGAELPLHSHPHKQTGYLVSGRMILKSVMRLPRCRGVTVG
jgi:quercetin dioxygenase-like cupin family protein